MTPLPLDATGLPSPGDIVAGKYQIENILGQGGMGAVVAARHMVLRKQVAIKFLLPSSTRMSSARERFLREGRAAAALQSEHVARVLDVGVLDNGTPYLVMEHLSGSDLGTVLRARGRLPISEAVDIILQACAAIGEAHALGIIHRDLKPQNIFLAQRTVCEPVVKVLDFGLARNPADDSDENGERLTTTSLVVGTPFYMSPEQLQSLKYVDARTDIWALGVILYELIAGHRPFDGPSVSWVYEGIRTRPPMPLQLCRHGVPPELDVQVLRCLEKNPACRVQSVPDLVQGLLPFAPQKSGFSATHLPGARSVAPPAPSLAEGASVAPVSTSITVQDQATVQINTTEERRAQPRSRKAGLVAVATAVVVGLLAGGAILELRMNSVEIAVEPRVARSVVPAGATEEAAVPVVASSVVEPREANSSPPVVSASAPPHEGVPSAVSSATRTGSWTPPPVKTAAPPRPPSGGPALAPAPTPTANPSGEEAEPMKLPADLRDPW
jgi:serine/threonine protein kinase